MELGSRDWWPVGSMSHIEFFVVSWQHCLTTSVQMLSVFIPLLLTQALVAALKSNQTVVDINLGSNYLGDEGAEACIVGTLWHLEMGTNLKWAQSETTLHPWRLFLLMHCKSSLDDLTLIERWWPWMLLFDAFWCMLISFDYVWFFPAGHCSFSQREPNHQMFEPGDVSHQGRWGGGEMCPASMLSWVSERNGKARGGTEEWTRQGFAPSICSHSDPPCAPCVVAWRSSNSWQINVRSYLVKKHDKHTVYVRMKVPNACWSIAILHETDALRPVVFVDSFLWRVSVFERRHWLRHCEATRCWRNWNCTATMLDPKEPRQGRWDSQMTHFLDAGIELP